MEQSQDPVAAVVDPRCCGLDVHKKSVAACVLLPGPEALPLQEVRTFGTMTADLLDLADWLVGHGVTHVGMESTGSYWKPIWNILEGNFELLLVNPQHAKALPGRKSDIKDCQWLAHLLRHGLLKASFVPDRGQRELRELTRYRMSMIQERTREVNRLQKVLEGANIKLAAVATDITGKSARAMLASLVSGNRDPKAMAELAKGRMRRKLPALTRALQGRFAAHQRFLIAELLAHIDYLDESLARVTAEIEERMRPFEMPVQRLDEITGVGRVVAQGMIAEMGTDMTRFPSERHISAWGGAAPGSRESAGKRKGSTTRKGNPALRRLLVQAGHAAGRAKSSYLSAQYYRLAARRGSKRAALAVGHSILVIAYHLLSDPERSYKDLGPNYFARRDPQKAVQHHVKQLMNLGYYVSLEKGAA
jgi:transposase